MASPPYAALIEWVPATRLVVEYVALPVLSRVPVPSCVVPSEKVTEPVGTPLPDAGVTAAAKVRLVPTAALVAEAVNVVVVATVTGAAFTVTVTAAEVLAANVESPA